MQPSFDVIERNSVIGCAVGIDCDSCGDQKLNGFWCFLLCF